MRRQEGRYLKCEVYLYLYTSLVVPSLRDLVWDNSSSLLLSLTLLGVFFHSFSFQLFLVMHSGCICSSVFYFLDLPHESEARNDLISCAQNWSGRPEFLAQEKVLQKNLVYAPVLRGTEAVERREVKNLSRKIKICTNVWKFIFFIVEAMYFWYFS